SNIATLHGADEYEGRVGIWMELIDGSTLQDLVERQGPFGAAEALQIGITLCSALAAVHRQGLTHGDIKAQNVMREKGGRIVLMDFSSSRSIAKVDEGAVLVGTPVYMAPELFQGSPPSLASDVYSVGVLLFFLVTGRYPIEARTLSELRERLSQGGRLLLHDLRPDLPLSFIEAVHRASSAEPMARFSSVGQLQSALSAALSERSPTHDGEGHPARVDVPASGDLQTLANAATYLSGLAGVAALQALLGVLNDALFNVTLHVPEDFTSYSLAGAVGIGFRSVVPCAILFLFNLAGLVALWTLGEWVPKLRVFARGVAARVEAASPPALATAFTFAAILAVGAGCFAFRSLLGLLVTIAEEPDSVVDVGALCPSTYHDVFALVFSELVIVLTAAWIAIFYAPARRAERDPTFRLMKWLALSVTLAAAIVMAAPWRLLTQSEVESFRIGAQKHYVIAEKDDDRFVYVPGAPPGERHRIMNRNVIPTGERKIENCFCEVP
ncbi:MAG: serine/threonine protein kinase, partial [Vicinamibacteria bacterium]